MADTARLGLPLLEAGQAQKHVTLNEALIRLDAFGASQALSRNLAAPPSAPAEGDLYIAPVGAAGDWAGLDNRLVAFANGGWIDAAPETGRRLWIADEGRAAIFDGIAWSAGDGAQGAVTESRVLTIDHAVAPGTASTTPTIIPDKAVVLGVTGRVLQALEGAGTWRLGVAGAADRYGGGLSVAEGAYAHGVTGQPVAYFGDTALRLEAESGAFVGGVVRLAVHFLALTPPRWP
jgi:hypothetical protein